MKEICVICHKTASHRCSRCKCVYYCSKEHQKEDWNLSHKSTCGKTIDSTNANGVNTADQRQCRCMFCGEVGLYSSEEETMKHMEVCPALNEQLNSPEQFHVPSSLYSDKK